MALDSDPSARESTMTEKPQPPLEGECCESECSPCVWDRYYEELAAWRQAQAQQPSAQQADQLPTAERTD